MPWRIDWSDRGLRDLADLDRSVASRVVVKLETIRETPERFFSRLKGGDDYKLRIGDYRVVAELNHATRTISISRVGHRSTIYDR